MMLWRLLRSQRRAGWLRVLLVCLALGVLMTAAIVTLAERLAGAPGWDLPLGIGGMFVVLTLSQIGRGWTGRQVGQRMADLAWRIRTGVLARYLALEPAALASVPPETLRSGLAAVPRSLAQLREQAVLSMSSFAAASGCLTAAVVLNPAAGGALLLVTKIEAVLLLGQVPRVRASQRRAEASEAAVAAAVGDLAHGFKQTLLDPARLAHTTGPAIEAATERRFLARAPVRGRLATREALTDSTRLIAAISVAAGNLLAGGTSAEGVAMLVIVYLIPLGYLRSIPLLASTGAAADRLAQLEGRLEAAAARVPPHASAAVSPTFASLELREAVWCHPARPGEPGAIVGPISCTITPGRVIFVTGASGSGKSTLLRMLCGFAAPDQGLVLQDGLAVDGRVGRALVAYVPTMPIPSAILRIAPADAAEAARLLADFALDTLVRIEPGRIVAPTLSPSQHQRLALIEALLQHRPILVLDEFASGHDAATRAYFYRRLLPQLRAQGVAVVVATQDRGFFDVADEIVWLRDGRRVDPPDPLP